MTSCTHIRPLIAVAILAAVAGHPVRGRADDAPCRTLVQRLVWDISLGVDPILVDSGENILKEIKSWNYVIKDPPSPEGFVGYDSWNSQALYKFDFDSDGLDDFVFITNGGTALCTKPYFLKSDEKKQLVQVKGIDTSGLENEGKLCNRWGQSLSFLYVEGTYYAVTKDFDHRDVEAILNHPAQAQVPVDYAVYKIGITEKSEPLCRVRMELRVE